MVRQKGFDIIAITDYRREDYPRMVALAPNGGAMEKTFDEWKYLADAAVGAAIMQGQRVVRIMVDPDEFASWLRANKLKSTPETRARYGLELANKKHGTH